MSCDYCESVHSEISFHFDKILKLLFVHFYWKENHQMIIVLFPIPVQNLDNWKSCRRKRVEHIIDRVVEAKKLEKEEMDRNRKKSKTFSEMMEER